jgi:prostamide/prostaglandin F2alpha synthase
MGSTLSAALAPISLPDVDGRDVRLGDLWKRRPAVLVFLRHYG